jgi:DNA repair exonuclease SbcCD ATPase subunit
MLAMCASSAVAEEVDVQDYTYEDLFQAASSSAKVALANGEIPMLGESQTPIHVEGLHDPHNEFGNATANSSVPVNATTPVADSELTSLRKENEEALLKINELKAQEALHIGQKNAAEETEEAEAEKQHEQDETKQQIDEQQNFLKGMNEKMGTADAATQIMKEIMDISQASQKKVRELREKLTKATTKEAVDGADEATSAQTNAVDEAQKKVEDLEAKLETMLGCETCDNKDKNVAELQEKLVNAKASLEKQEAATKTVEAAAKDSVKKAAAGRITRMQSEMEAAKKRLSELEKQVCDIGLL